MVNPYAFMSAGSALLRKLLQHRFGCCNGREQRRGNNAKGERKPECTHAHTRNERCDGNEPGGFQPLSSAAVEASAWVKQIARLNPWSGQCCQHCLRASEGVSCHAELRSWRESCREAVHSTAHCSEGPLSMQRRTPRPGEVRVAGYDKVSREVVSIVSATEHKLSSAVRRVDDIVWIVKSFVKHAVLNALRAQVRMHVRSLAQPCGTSGIIRQVVDATCAKQAHRRPSERL
mmetsp:Transcript_84730/g.197019  ORF Transcript_84730/g.197019 Transcript_84730/m.197019 type:complete len:232 (-) Transcript_84730:54-749(-)